MNQKGTFHAASQAGMREKNLFLQKTNVFLLSKKNKQVFFIPCRGSGNPVVAVNWWRFNARSFYRQFTPCGQATTTDVSPTGLNRDIGSGKNSRNSSMGAVHTVNRGGGNYGLQKKHVFRHYLFENLYEENAFFEKRKNTSQQIIIFFV